MKKPIKKPISHTITWYVDHARVLASNLAKHRDKYRCLRCGRSAEAGWKIDGSHIKPKGTHKSMSADVENIKALCSNCHRWWHANPTESGLWFKTTFPAWHKELTLMAMKPIPMGKFEWKKKYEALKEEFSKILQ